MSINWNIENNYLTILCVFEFKGFHNGGGGGGVGGLALKSATGLAQR